MTTLVGDKSTMTNKKMSRSKADSKKTVSDNAEKAVDNVNKQDLTIDDYFTLIDLYFKQKNIMYTHLYNSCDKLLDEDIPSFLSKDKNNVFFEKITKDKVYRYKFVYENLAIKPPMLENEDESMFPSHARSRNLTYGAKLVATVKQVQDSIDIATDKITSKVIGTPEYEYPIANIPLMVRSKYCTLNLKKGADKTECDMDPGGYFIVNGSEKVVMSLERMINNKPLVFMKKDSSANIYKVQVNSYSHETEAMQIAEVRIRKDSVMTLRVPILSEVPVFIVMRALGIESDRDIINYVVYDSNDTDMLNIVRVSLENSKPENSNDKITTQEEAINYLLTKMRVIKKYSETDQDVRQKEKKMHLMTLLKNNFLPHVSGDLIDKAYYLGYMINRLLQCFLERIPIDDRDSFANKRIDLPGTLMFDLFKQFYKKMLNECNKFFKKRLTDDNNPMVIINQIKPTTIEQGLKTALLTGAWAKKKGVAQMLQRMTYLQTLSSLRRINSPTVDASTNKLTSPRHLHPSSIGFVCVTGDTEIVLSNGIIKRIKDFEDCDQVITINQKTLLETPSSIRNYFTKMPDKLLKLTTISGREIKCTPDHPLLVSLDGKYIWKKAGELTTNDKLIIRHSPCYIECENENPLIIKSSDVSPQYVFDLQKLKLLDRPLTQEETEILARLVGASITDGHVHKHGKYYDASFSLGEPNDCYDITDDIMSLGFSCPSVNRVLTRFRDKTTYRTYAVTKNGAFAYLLSHLGAFVGKKTTQARKLPEWIINGSLRTKREFLCGFLGGDGGRVSIQKQKSGWKLHIGMIHQFTKMDLLEATEKYMNSIFKLFSDFGVTGSISKTEIINDDGDKGYDYVYRFDESLENVSKFSKYFCFRYCNEKQRASNPPIEYIKHKKYLFDCTKAKYQKVIDMYGQYPLKQITAETGIEHREIYKILERHKPGEEWNIKLINFTKYDQFIKNYKEIDDKMSIKIDQIEEIQPEPVYDFETLSNNHSFIANSIATHNCYIETSEGHKVGLVKNLALMGNVTVMLTDQVEHIKGIIRDRVTKIQDIASNELKDYTRVFLNGEWLGVTQKPRVLYRELKDMKYRGTIDIHTSIIHEIKSEVESRELKIYCDSGRLFRPILRVENNKLLLNKSHIDMISLDGSKNPTKISSWNEFMAKNPGIIEYVDVDEQSNSMISMFPDEVELMEKRMKDTAQMITKLDIKPNQTVINRYDDFTYVKYTHCEIHPSMHIGVVACNIPYCNRNQGPRNIYQYSQARTAMGIYVTNWRHRMDISYVLYHPQRPIVTTRSMPYVNTDKIPAGENVIVAMACYSGYNQEDSVVMNQSGIDRGLYRSESLYKHMTTIQKNQSTSQDDLFIKPDPTKVTGMRHGSYDKLNEHGYVPEGTPIVKGDIILAKVSPIQPVGNSIKTFKDNSEVYKSAVPGVVDKVETGLFNQEGYEMRKMRVRSMRIPHIGDKVCSRMGQKGTIGITLKQSDMPFNKDGISPDIIMNPNALPSRMTCGQFVECLAGKISALRGHEIDGTPFNKNDLEQMKDILESLGFERNANEYLYNGMTGRKMKTMIFIGPTYYQRLKHMVSDKAHSRSRGPRTVLTRQPPEGRSRDGGLRLGEMERDSLLSHGVARYLKEKTVESADAYTCHVCGVCGLFAQRLLKRDNKPYATSEDVYHCPACKNKTEIYKIRIPYAFKLLLQEMMSMNIAPRIRVRKNQFD